MQENNNESSGNGKTKFTSEQLKEMQAWDLDKKIAVSKTRIIEFYEHFKDKIIVLISQYNHRHHRFHYIFLVGKNF